MPDYKVLFLDIDGTIMKHDGTMEQSTIDAIKIAQEQNIEVFLATGRPLHEISYIADQLNIHSFIGYNGAYAIYKDKVIVNEPMPPALISRYMSIASKLGHDMLMYTSKQNLFTTLESKPIKEMISYLNFQHNGLLSREIKEEILGVSLLNVTKEDLKHYQGSKDIHFEPVLAQDVEGRNFYDAIRDNVNKGEAVKKLMNHLKFPLESSIAFGDGMNDKEMLSVTGESFAMANAHPSLFDYAKHTTSDVNDGGVFNGLASLGLMNNKVETKN
ncbi:HAD family hydrolase [Sediminibacillus massiliensis]|uniref:HAD family hydrolase n=1 Tax=Sediminibacillus massiliensis TaxID=1926277 RepID=UPI0009885238|nr:HAD family hydrolase [Sediminibacillus massiliensis]